MVPQTGLRFHYQVNPKQSNCLQKITISVYTFLLVMIKTNFLFISNFVDFLLPAKRLGLVQKSVAPLDYRGHHLPSRCTHPQSTACTAAAPWTLLIAGLQFWAAITTILIRTSWSTGPSTMATFFVAVSKLCPRVPPCPPFQMYVALPASLPPPQPQPLSSTRKSESSKPRLRPECCAATLIPQVARYHGPMNASWAGSQKATTAARTS